MRRLFYPYSPEGRQLSTHTSPTADALELRIRELQRERDTLLMKDIERDIRLYVERWLQALIDDPAILPTEPELFEFLDLARKEYRKLRARWTPTTERDW